MLRPGKDKGLATPIPLGLAALGTTAFLMGFAFIFQSTATWAPYLTQALLFGGLIEMLAGMWAFAYGDPLAATAFSFLGAFFGWWGLSHLPFMGTAAATAATMNSMALVFIVCGVVTLYMWVASFYEFAAFNLVLLFLWIAFGLVGIGELTGVLALGVLGGIASIISGLIAGYGSFAAIYNATSLDEVVPLGESLKARERNEQFEMDRLRRLSSAGNGGIHTHAEHTETRTEIRP